MSRRIQQINNLIKRIFAEILHNEVSEAHFGLLTVSQVETSKDLSQAKIWISCLKNGDDLKKMLKPKLYNIQKIFNKSISLKKTPRIIVEIDNSSLKADRIESILRKWKNSIKNKKKQ